MQHLICMVYGGLEDLSNIKSKYGKKEYGASYGDIIYNINLGIRRQSF